MAVRKFRIPGLIADSSLNLDASAISALKLFGHRPPTFVGLGDSHIAGLALDTNLNGTGLNDDVTTFYPTAPWRYFGYSNQITHAMIRLGWRLKPLACFGRGGDSVGPNPGISTPTPGYTSRLPLIAAIKPLPGYCFLEGGGGNDQDQGVPNSTIFANLATCIDSLNQMGIVPIVLEYMPWSPITGGSTLLANRRAALVNGVRDTCRNMACIYVSTADIGMGVNSQFASSWGSGTFSSMTNEGIHLSHQGASLYGDRIARTLDPLIPYFDDSQFTDYDAATVLGQGTFHSGMTSGPGGALGAGCSGRVAPRLTVACTAGTAVCRIQPRRGSAERAWQEVTLTSPGTQFQVSFASLTNVITPGQSVVTTIEVQAGHDWKAVTRLSLSQQFNSVSGWSTACGEPANENTYLTAPHSPRGMPVILRTPAGVTPSDATTVSPILQFYGDGGTIRFSRALSRVES